MKLWLKLFLGLCAATVLIGVGIWVGRSSSFRSDGLAWFSAPQPAVQSERANARVPLMAQPQFAVAGVSPSAGGAPAGTPPQVTLADVAAGARNSVVSVATVQGQRRETGGRPSIPFQLPFPFSDRFGGAPFGEPAPERRREGLGSGVVVSRDGVILTNNHVVEGASEVTVIDADDNRYRAKVVGADPPSDVAVLKVDNPNGKLVPLPFGDSGAVRAGDVVLAIGNPFGVGHTVTMGIVSAKGRSGMGIVDYEDFIQTDAAINPGNSGGALIAMDGRLIGINTAILSRTGAYAGIGFAVPAAMAQPIMNSLLESGKVERGFLGVNIQTIEPGLAEALNLSSTRGALVSDVTQDSPAAKAGLKQGDVIIEFDGSPVADASVLRNVVAAKKPGQTVKIEISRDGQRSTLSVVLGQLEAKSTQEPTSAAPGPSFGLGLAPLTDELRQQLNVDPEVKSGVVISAVTPGSPADEAGLRRGDLLLEVNRNAVSSPARAAELLEDKTKRALLLVYREGNKLFVALDPPSGG